MKINCNNINCVFNKDSICKKENIKIEGLFVKIGFATFCCSFKNKSELSNVELKENKCVECSANYCKFFENDLCHKEEISIVGKANYRSQTQCNSFKNRGI